MYISRIKTHRKSNKTHYNMHFMIAHLEDLPANHTLVAKNPEPNTATQEPKNIQTIKQFDMPLLFPRKAVISSHRQPPKELNFNCSIERSRTSYYYP